ncbi:protein stichel-like 2 [Phtheirospermum japonicum]|uniref:Protein stichel-like 2 n=1 Tax=Phtheirospermum japonicum TaxID=374723 RepID=A0A830BNM5_9LAMI|nr:protein stichel-like 2 [Phtheirospermum japonicum]
MDGRRHSVDVPISRTLIALRRVRSLRDPSTHSMSKLSALIDNFNWETNSNNSITLGFDTDFHKGTRDEEKLVSDHELYYGPSRRKSNARVLDSETVQDYDGGGSCDEISTQNEKRLNGESNFKIWHSKLDGDVLSRSGSPCLYKNEDVGFMGSCHQGCGISSCWSRTRKFKDSNIEELPLLVTGEKLPYLESSPRNLCQKFTPKSFNELVGQGTVSTSLLNAISKRQINSLYLFHGPRGTGKTSASRIFAAALNCISPNSVNKPCGLCQECDLFFSGRSRDFKEVDALGINKTGRCRSLVKSAWAPPVYSRFKVYVVEECHLLHREAWAVILGGLEGISRNVVFIMVTPSLDKVPRSAVSKARVYHFQRVKEVDIAGRLGRMCVQEGLEFEEDALNFIANKSNGSLRDAEMMLDQLSLLGKKITVSLVYEVNGVVSNDELLDLLHLALSSDASNTVKRARELLRSGIEPLQLVSQLANLIMDILAGKFPDGVSEIRKKLFVDNSEADMQQLSHALKILSQAEKQLRTSKNQTTWLTVALLQLSSTGSSHDMNDARLSTRTLNAPEGDFHSTSSTGESLKCSVACGCDDDEPDKVGTNTKDDKETLELIWLRAIGICTPRSFKKFLRKRGKLVDIRLMHAGTAVAELEFDRPDYVTKAEKSWKVIAGALQHMLGYNVELRINLANNETNKHEKFKNRYFSLFNCSRRVHLKSHFSAECKSNASGTSDSTPTTLTKDKYVETCTSECGSHIAHTCCHSKELFKTIRSKDGNALCVGLSTPSMARDDKSGAHIWNEQVNKDGPNSIHLKPGSKPSSRKEHSKFRCWKTAMFPFRKAWQLRHQPRGEGLVDYALHCAVAK